MSSWSNRVAGGGSSASSAPLLIIILTRYSNGSLCGESCLSKVGFDSDSRESTVFLRASTITRIEEEHACTCTFAACRVHISARRETTFRGLIGGWLELPDDRNTPGPPPSAFRSKYTAHMYPFIFHSCFPRGGGEGWRRETKEKDDFRCADQREWARPIRLRIPPAESGMYEGCVPPSFNISG